MRKLNIKRPVCFFSMFFVLLLWLILALGGGVDLSEKYPDSYNLFFEGKITNKSTKNYSEILYLSSNESPRKNYVVYLSDKNISISELHIGQYISVSGEYLNFDLPENEGQFNMRKYYRIKGIEGAIKKAKIHKVSRKYDVFLDYLYVIKENAKDVFEMYLSKEDAGTMEALVLGDKDRLNEEIKELYQEAGFSHILSLSGLHIATVGLFLLKLLKRLGIGNKSAAFISVVIMVSYSLMTGFSTSTMRALVMFILGVLALCLGRTYDLITAVNFSIILILFENPYYIYDSGFLLSVSSVFGIALLCPIFEDVFVNKKVANKRRENDYQNAWKNKTQPRSYSSIFTNLSYDIYFYLIKGLSVSLSAILGTLPVSLMSFYKISTYGIVLNLGVVPFVGFILFIGIIGVLLYYVGLHNTTKTILIPAAYILDYYKNIADFITKVKGNNWVAGSPEKWQIVVYLVLIFVAILIYKNGIKIINSRKTNPNFIKVKGKYERIFKLLFLLVVILAVSIFNIKQRNDYEVRVVSVGQGACNIVSGDRIPNMMIDGGSSSIKDVFKYRIKPVLFYNGISEIDYIFISHPDEDHVNGIKELLMDDKASIKVNHIFMSVYDDEIHKLASDRNIQIHEMKMGDKIRNNRILIECISPSKDDVISNADVNESSLVLKITDLETGYNCVFTGDIGKETENKIVNNECINNVDRGVSRSEVELNGMKKTILMTVPHHGSKYSSSEEFLKYVNPLISTISCGKDNTYGHPHKEALERLESIKTNVIRTDEVGQITIVVSGDAISIKRFNESILARGND